MRGLEGARVVVTGGARGIGRATVERLVDEGASVAILDLLGIGEQEDVRGWNCDITVADQVREAVAGASEWLGGLDVLVNNAGVTSYFDPVEMAESEWDSVFAADLKGAWLCARECIPHLRRSSQAAIVNVSSIHGKLTIDGMFPYAAAKSGLEGLTRSLALDLADDGIRVLAVAPGYTRTEMSEDWVQRQPDPEAAAARITGAVPMSRMAESQEVAAVICFAASTEASAMTGAVIPVDGGLGVRFAS